MSGKNPALRRVGEAAIAARMSDAEIAVDPGAALKIAMDAMRATLGLTRPARSSPSTTENNRDA